MMSQDFSIETAFAGGNIVVEKIEGDRVFLRQDLRDTQGDWFYWAFRVRGAENRCLTFHFTGSDVLGARGAACSLDEGKTWHWLEEGSTMRAGDKAAFSYRFAPQAHEVLFAFCPLYTQRNLNTFLSRHKDLERSTLCRSRGGRDVELIRLANPSASLGVLLTARHHACEAMASNCLEGILEAAVAGDETGAWLREHVDFAVVPFVDKDGVEAGDQGKNRKPYDHNRDYGGATSDSIYPEVRALREWAPAWLASHERNIALDLHCPWIRGGCNEEVYFVGLPDEAIWQRVLDFARVLEARQRGPLPYRQSNNLPFGCDWNTLGGDAIGGRTCAKWVCGLPGIHFAATLEVPYANAGGVPVTPQSARALGHDLAVAFRRYLVAL